MFRAPALSLFSLLVAGAALAQEPPPPANPGPVLENGNFDKTYDAPNLWYGIDHDGFLAGPKLDVKAIDEWGNIGNQAMPVSVAMGDLNADGLPDILSVDPLGYVRVYFNGGSKTEPKFAAGELSLPYLAVPDGDPPWTPLFSFPPEANTGFGTDENIWRYQWSQRRQAPRGSLAPGGRGVLDLWVGNYFGDIIYIRNQGAPAAPAFAQPRPFQSALVPTTKDPQKRWGNIFAPLYADWSGDGKPDLLVGEGSYSANNIHKFPNDGSPDSPSFDEDKRRSLALGNGRQHLTPAMADVNGDGREDLLVSDRGGRVAVYLRPANLDPNRDLEFSGFLSGAGLTKDDKQAVVFGEGITTVTAGDLNGDQLFDIVVGRSNGRLAWSANRGSANEPKFEGAEEMRSTATAPPITRLPEGWWTDAGLRRGNFFGLITVLSGNEDPAIGDRQGKVLKMGFQAPVNKIIKRPDVIFPSVPKYNPIFDPTGRDNFFRLGNSHGVYVHDAATRRLREAASNVYLLRRQLGRLEIGKTYALTFDAKGQGISRSQVNIGWRGFRQTGEKRVIRGERGAVTRVGGGLFGETVEGLPFSPGGNWSQIRQDIKVNFRKNEERELNKEKMTTEAVLEIYAELTPPEGALYIANLKLEPVP